MSYREPNYSKDEDDKEASKSKLEDWSEIGEDTSGKTLGPVERRRPQLREP